MAKIITLPPIKNFHFNKTSFPNFKLNFFSLFEDLNFCKTNIIFNNILAEWSQQQWVPFFVFAHRSTFHVHHSTSQTNVRLPPPFFPQSSSFLPTVFSIAIVAVKPSICLLYYSTQFWCLPLFLILVLRFMSYNAALIHCDRCGNNEPVQRCLPSVGSDVKLSRVRCL